MRIRVEWRVKLPAGDGGLILWSRRLLIGIGVLVLAYVAIVLIDAQLYQSAQARRLQLKLDAAATANSGGELVRITASRETGTASRFAPLDILGYGTRGDPPLGRLDIGSIGLSAMIQEGTDPRTLRRSLGHIPGTSLPGRPGNVAVTGHRDTFFRPLNRIRKGDEITLTTVEALFRYRVDSIRVVEPEDTAVLADSPNAVLTLVTCYPFYYVGPAPRRFIVRALLIDLDRGGGGNSRTYAQ